MAESFTTRLIQRFQIEQKKNDRGGVYALTQRMLAYHSNRIEGSTLMEKQTASLFDTGTLTSEDALIRAKDVEEMTGHFLMFNEMLKTYAEPLFVRFSSRHNKSPHLLDSISYCLTNGGQFIMACLFSVCFCELNYMLSHFAW